MNENKTLIYALVLILGIAGILLGGHMAAEKNRDAALIINAEDREKLTSKARERTNERAMAEQEKTRRKLEQQAIDAGMMTPEEARIRAEIRAMEERLTEEIRDR
jgi:hypothetical protein